MRSAKYFAAGLLISAVFALTGCGGGGEAEVSSGPEFEIGALVGNRPVAGVDVLPGERQTIYVAVGLPIELDSTGPVDWSVFVGGSAVPPSGSTIYYGGATIDELTTTRTRFAIGTSSVAPLQVSIPITVYATSLVDRGQVAQIDIVLTN
jgi:hypothetical protein